MREVKVKLYQFNELQLKQAKERAREWMREGNSEDFDPEFEQFETAAKLLGIDLDSRAIQTHGGKTRYEPHILYSGFSSPGDGASFVGTYEFNPGCSEAIREEFGGDGDMNTRLHEIADGLTTLHVGWKLLGKSPGTVKITQDGRGVHKYTMGLEMSDANEALTCDDEQALLKLMRDFADWIYRSLEAEYEWLMSNEAIDESLEANEYEFTEDGERA
jgi:hypothetical protein